MAPDKVRAEFVTRWIEGGSMSEVLWLWPLCEPMPEPPNTDFRRWTLLMQRGRQLREAGKFEAAARMVNLATRVRKFGWPVPPLEN